MKMRDKSSRNIKKNKKIWAVILLVVFVILYKPPIVEAIGNLFRSAFYALTDIQPFQLNLKTPHAGEHVLPSAVQEMLTLLRAHHLNDYQISERIRIAENGLIHQRIIESAWPIRMNPKSDSKFIFISETDTTTNCMEIERKKEIALVFCN